MERYIRKFTEYGNEFYPLNSKVKILNGEFKDYIGFVTALLHNSHEISLAVLPNGRGILKPLDRIFLKKKDLGLTK